MTNRGRNSRYTELRSDSALDNNQLMRVAPSIFAEKPWVEMSPKYTFIPTIQVVEKLRNEGFYPYYVGQGVTRIPGKQDFTKHLLRFRYAGAESRLVLGTVPEIVLVNAHDGMSRWKMFAGLFRMVCMNGLIAGDTFKSVNVTHRGSVDGIVEASYEIVDQFPQLLDQVQEFSSLRLTAPEQQVFAQAALVARYEDEPAPITPAQLVAPRRTADAEPTLWNTYNVVQEHLVNGGLRGQNQETGRRTRSRAVSSISKNTSLNKALWSLAESMAKIKAEQSEPALVAGFSS